MEKDNKNKKTVIIIGAGPAGLTAAYELLSRANIRPIVIEADSQYVGGISRTVNYKGNRIDVGGHRFFSKSDRVMRWWSQMLPVKLPENESVNITYQRTTRALTQGLKLAAESDKERVMWVRPRKTRIIYGGNFFSYPVELSLDTLLKLGIKKTFKIALTYILAVLFPRRPERTLEDFFLNRFGRELYETFFKSYTEKVWGVSCGELSAEWGAQRVKGLSVMKALLHPLRKAMRVGPLSRSRVETSLIEQFLYPTYGPGQMWEAVAEKIRGMGGEILMSSRAKRVVCENKRIVSVDIERNGQEERVLCDYLFSTTDIRSLFLMMSDVPKEVLDVSNSLQYRNFIVVGLLLKDKPRDTDGSLLTDTWMYVHEPDVLAGRIQFFHNWQPKLAKNPVHGWVGLEYFMNEDDKLWNMSDEELILLGGAELEKIGFGQGIEIIDATVVRQPKAYPGYFGAYAFFPKARTFLDDFKNLYAIGRNGMHRYNNQDHSMLSAMTAVDNIIQNIKTKDNIWAVNAEQDYHEEK